MENAMLLEIGLGRLALLNSMSNTYTSLQQQTSDSFKLQLLLCYLIRFWSTGCTRFFDQVDRMQRRGTPALGFYPAACCIEESSGMRRMPIQLTMI